jgi:hypothetical protein
MADAPAIALQDSKGRKPFAALHRFTAATGRTAMGQDSRAEVIKRAARHLGRVLFVEYFYLTLVVVSLAVLLVPPLIAPKRMDEPLFRATAHIGGAILTAGAVTTFMRFCYTPALARR